MKHVAYMLHEDGKLSFQRQNPMNPATYQALGACYNHRIKTETQGILSSNVIQDLFFRHSQRYLWEFGLLTYSWKSCVVAGFNVRCARSVKSDRSGHTVWQNSPHSLMKLEVWVENKLSQIIHDYVFSSYFTITGCHRTFEKQQPQKKNPEKLKSIRDNFSNV